MFMRQKENTSNLVRSAKRLAGLLSLIWRTYLHTYLHHPRTEPWSLEFEQTVLPLSNELLDLNTQLAIQTNNWHKYGQLIFWAWHTITKLVMLNKTNHFQVPMRTTLKRHQFFEADLQLQGPRLETKACERYGPFSLQRFCTCSPKNRNRHLRVDNTVGRSQEKNYHGNTIKTPVLLKVIS